MSPLAVSRAWFGALFLPAALILAAVNAWVHGPAVAGALFGGQPDRADAPANGFLAARRAAADFIGKDSGRTARGRLYRAAGKHEVDHFAIITGRDGLLYPGGLYALDTANAGLLAEGFADLAALAAERGTPVVYVAAPDLVIKGGSDVGRAMPVLDYNPALDAVLYSLRQDGVPALDARYLFLAGRQPAAAIRARTAPLLTGRALLALFGWLTDTLNREFLPGLDPEGFFRNRANYRLEDHPRFFMGALGHRTGPALGGLDDFTTVTPAFDSDLSLVGLDRYRGEVAIRGAAEEVLLRPEALLDHGNLYSFYPESFYAHSAMLWSVVDNHRNDGGPRILFLHDFYTAPLASLLAPAAGRLATLALQDGQTRSAAEALREDGWDIVIASFFPANLLRPETRALLGEFPERDRPDQVSGNR